MKKQISNLGEKLSKSEQLGITGGHSYDNAKDCAKECDHPCYHRVIPGTTQHVWLCYRTVSNDQ